MKRAYGQTVYRHDFTIMRSFSMLCVRDTLTGREFPVSIRAPFGRIPGAERITECEGGSLLRAVAKFNRHEIDSSWWFRGCTKFEE